MGIYWNEKGADSRIIEFISIIYQLWCYELSSYMKIACLIVTN